MHCRSSKIAATAVALAAFALAGCGDSVARSEPEADMAMRGSQAGDCHSGPPQPDLGLMTSLPLIWPLGAEFGAIARGEVDPPWQHAVISECFAIVPLDTLSPIAAIDPGLPDTDPLAGLEYLAVIQPRGLSPADNVALDEWVNAGGHLLLVLDPMLTGEYDVPLGDPRRPNDTALIPPVVGRWGLSISYDDGLDSEAGSQGADHEHPPGVIAYGEIVSEGAPDTDCQIGALSVLATCNVGEGRVTLYADAAIFEHRDTDGENAEAIRALMRNAFR